MAAPGNVSAWLFKVVAASPQDATSNPFLDIIGSRTSGSASALYIDGVNTQSTVSADSGALVALAPCYGGRGISGPSADMLASFIEQVSFYGSSLSSTDVANLRARVATLKTALGR